MLGPFLVALYDGGIPLFGGIYATLLAYGVIGKTPGESPRFDAWRERYGRSLKWLGPALILFGVVQIISAYMHAPQR